MIMLWRIRTLSAKCHQSVRKTPMVCSAVRDHPHDPGQSGAAAGDGQGANVRVSRRRNTDDGAAAVEFALLLPIFLLILFGVIFFGFAFNTKINLTQTARETSRYGATLSLKASAPGNSGTIDTWLTKVTDVAKSAGGDDLTSTSDGRYICVAMVTSGVTKSLTTGTGGPASSAPCYSDGRTDNRVQVVVRTNAIFNGLIFGGTITLDSSSTTKYEAVATS